jgi:hypothetical protein
MLIGYEIRNINFFSNIKILIGRATSMIDLYNLPSYFFKVAVKYVQGS